MTIETGLPQDWKERISNKKVILYVTSLGNMLSGGMQHIEKIGYVLDIFHQYQEDVILWWRPHPLEISTLESMRPDLLEKYMRIREQYEKEGWGILDTTADVHRAIAISDAYYGDWSSVIQLYEKTRKPILLSKDFVLKSENELAFSVADFQIVGDYIWFISFMYNALFKMNKQSFVIEEIIEIPGENFYEQESYKFIIKQEEKLFLIPSWSKNVVVFDLDTKRIKKIKVAKQTDYSKFCKVYIEHGKLYLINSKNQEVLQINIDNYDLRLEKNGGMKSQNYVEEYKNIIIQRQSDKKKIEDYLGELENQSQNLIYTCIKVYDQRIYTFLYHDNIWKIIDIKRQVSEMRTMDTGNCIKERMRRILFTGILGEDYRTYSLSNFIEMIIRQQSKTVYNEIPQSGKTIHEICKNIN